MFSVKSVVDQAAVVSLALTVQLFSSASLPALANDASPVTSSSAKSSSAVKISQAQATKASTTKAPVAGLTLKKPAGSDAKQVSAEAMLSDLRDARLSLNQLKQQAINLFLEATRSAMTVNDAPIEQSPTSISLAMLDANKKYQAPRKEWLVLYVNTLEPIVHLLCEDIEDVDTHGHSVSKAIEERVNPLWDKWRDDVLSINKSLDEVQGSLPVGDDEESAGSNVVIAKAALNMFQKAEELEKVRYQAALILIEEYKKEAAAKGAEVVPAASLAK